MSVELWQGVGVGAPVRKVVVDEVVNVACVFRVAIGEIAFLHDAVGVGDKGLSNEATTTSALCRRRSPWRCYRPDYAINPYSKTLTLQIH